VRFERQCCQRSHFTRANDQDMRVIGYEARRCMTHRSRVAADGGLAAGAFACMNRLREQARQQRTAGIRLLGGAMNSASYPVISLSLLPTA
jgi:hypothetical protein